MVVVTACCFPIKRINLAFGQSRSSRSLLAQTENDEGVAVLLNKGDGDVGVFWSHGITSSRQSIRNRRDRRIKSS